MARDPIDYTHGDTGTKPPSPLNFEENGRPDSEYFDWWWYRTVETLNLIWTEFDRIDSNDDGIVDEADNALLLEGNSWSDIPDVVANSDADTVDGSHLFDIKNWVNTQADVPNADHADVAEVAERVEVRNDDPPQEQGRGWIRNDIQ